LRKEMDSVLGDETETKMRRRVAVNQKKSAWTAMVAILSDCWTLYVEGGVVGREWV